MNEQDKLDPTQDSEKTLTDLEPKGEIKGGGTRQFDGFVITFDRPT